MSSQILYLESEQIYSVLHLISYLQKFSKEKQH